MQLSKNKKYQFSFFFIISIYSLFNGGNSNLLIQLNFILISLLFLICLMDKNYNQHLKVFYINNKLSISFYFLFLIYIFFQIIPINEFFLSLFSPEKLKFYYFLSNDKTYKPISFAPSNTFFQIINFLSLFIIVCIMRMIFYSNRHKYRLYLFISILGFICSIFAVILFLNGNPNILFIENSSYKDSSTGFFTNRTVFAVFLLFSLISSLELLSKYDSKLNKDNKDEFFLKIYVRLFVIFITIGIITSFSRIGNFLLLLTISVYLINYILLKKRKSSFINIILLIIVFDIFILGFYFGTSKLIDRFYFLNEEFASFYDSKTNFERLQIIKFSFSQLDKYLFFGYGAGAYETIFQLNFKNSDSFFANHAHSDLIEFLGEFGLIGLFLFIFSFIKYFSNINNYNLVNIILICFLIIICCFDFSLHIPIIQVMFAIFYSLNYKATQSN